MGQAATLALAEVGQAVGSYFGGPVGGEIGFLSGELLGNILFPKKGPNPPAVRVQDSAYGKYIPMAWGRYRMAGNVIWMGTPHSHGTSGGKGGASKQGQPYTTLSFAVALCQGPISGITRIWANGQLIYDISDPADWKSLSGSSSMVTGWTVYYGTETQMPDPLMESYTGANTPAYRGMAYVVFNELSLQQWGNYMPSLTFEVQGAGATTGSANISAAASNPPLSDTGDGGWAPSSIQAGGSVSGLVMRSYQSGGTIIGQWAGFSLTSYGTSFSAVASTSLGANTLAAHYVTYDQDGNGRVLMDDGALYGSSGFRQANAGPVTGFLLFGDGVALVANGSVFCSTQVGAGFVNSVGASSMSYQGTRIVRFLGATASYVWALDTNNHLLQLDLAGNLVTDHGVTPGSGNLGVAYADDEIYVTDASNAVWQFNGSSWVKMPYVAPPSFVGATLLSVQDNMVVIAGNNQVALQPFTSVASTTTGEIISSVCELAGLQASQFDVSQMTDTVIGFASTDNSSPRDILKPLLSTYFIDVSDSDGMLKFVRRGATPTVTIPWDDLGADTNPGSAQQQSPITETVTQEVELPRSETISYLSSSTDYQTLTQRAFNSNTLSNLDETVSVPIVLADNDARQRAEAMLWERWSKRRGFAFSTTYKWLQIEPGDAVFLQQASGATVPVRIKKVQASGNGVYTFNADFTVPQLYPNPGAQYTVQAGIALGVPAQKVPYSGPTVLEVMDIPPLRAQDATAPGLYLGACGFTNDWPGAIVDVSRDDVNFTQAAQALQAAVIGQATTALGAFSGGNIPDELNQVTIQLFNPDAELSSVSYASFLNGANVAYLGGEIFFFRSATQISSNQWTLSGLLRGQIGTEAKASTHAMGEYFVLLNSANIYPVGINLSDIGQTLWFEPYLNNLLGSTPGQAVSAQPGNARLAPLAPHMLKVQPILSPAASFMLHWFRRARVNYQWLDGADVPLDFSQESYRINISNSSGTLVNSYVLTSAGVTWNGGTPQSYATNPVNQSLPPFSYGSGQNQPYFVYTSAMAANDGFSSGQSITATVSQIGDYGVPGGTASVTFTI